MKLYLFIIIALCLVEYQSASAQESGWADSSGYKQQQLKSGAVKQVIYSQSGDTLYSVHLDSLFHIYHWNAETGVLLRSQTINKFEYKTIFSVTISNDCKTYSVCGLQKDTYYHVKIYSLFADGLLYDLPLKITEIQELSAVFNSKLKILNCFYRSLADQRNPYGPSGTNYGGNLLYSLAGVLPEQLRFVYGAVKQYSIATERNVVAWVGYYHTVRYYKGLVEVNNSWMESFLCNDTLTIQKPVTFETTGLSTDIYNSEYAKSYFPIVTPNSKHYFFIDHQTMNQWSLKPYGLISTILLPFVPSIAVPSPDNIYLLMTSGRQILLYHSTANSITDSLTSTFDFSSVAFRPNTKSVVVGSDDGYLRTMKLPYTPATVNDDFSADRIKMYVDSSITFSLVSSKKIVQYSWDFGDGTIDSTETAVHRYNSPGIYSVRLILTDTSGNIDTILKKDYITIIPHLIPKFTATPRYGKTPLNVQFKDESKGAIVSWKWDFGDGSTDSLQNPFHVYLGRNYYHVSLEIGDSLSTSILNISYYINGDTIPSDSFNVIKKWLDPAISQHINGDNFNVGFDNLYSKAIIKEDENLYVYKRECQSRVDALFPNSPIYYLPDQAVLTINKDAQYPTITVSLGTKTQNNSCDAIKKNSGFQIIRKRNGGFITSFVRLANSNYQSGGNPDGIYFSNGRYFAPLGWTHDFDGAFLPDGTDIYLFRSGYTSSLQFFTNDSVLIARDSLIGDVMRPFSSADSQSVTVIANPYLGIGDSSRWIIQRTYSLFGDILLEKRIEKGKSIRLTDAADIGWGDFLICGWVNTTDSAGKNITMGYIAKIGSDGRLSWEYTTPAWQSFAKFQRSGEFYAVWGIPQKGYNHGFTAIRTDGGILSDNRLTRVSNQFSPSDFIVGKGSDELWFIGSEKVTGQGQRAVIYLCNNPLLAITGIQENATSLEKIHKISATIFPIPATRDFTLRLNAPSHCFVKISIVSILGIEKQQSTIECHSGHNEFLLSTDELSSGMYALKIQSGNELHTIPLVIVQ